MTIEEARLVRIENKLDKVGEALSNLARVEEKVSATNNRIDRLEFRADEQENDIDRIKGIVGYNNQTVKNFERFVWLVVSAFIGTAMYFLR
jgi:uncharacterized coiled-coil protein SlyX